MADDELKQRRLTERAAQARLLVESPLLKEAFAVFEAGLTQLWRDSTMADAAGRERAWSMLKAAQAVQKHLEQVIIDGRVAGRILEQMAGKRVA